MQLSGNQQLVLPNVDSFYFEFNNLVFGDYSGVTLSFVNNSTSTYLAFSGGKVIIPAPSGTMVIASYNSGQPFSLSGWYMQNPNGSDNFLYGYVNDVVFNITGIPRDKANYISFTPTSSTPFSFENVLSSFPISYTVQIPNQFQIGTACTGYISSNVSGWIYSGDLVFYNSLQPLITGVPIIAPVGNVANTLIFSDVDASSQNNQFDFQIILNTPSGEWYGNFTTNRTGLYNAITTNLSDLNSTTTMSGLFNGIWSGNQFIYKDAPESITLNYFHQTFNEMGIQYSDTLTVAWGSNQVGTGYKSEYVTGFTLTASGEYLSPPTALFTGYYHVTGIQQSYISLLFSSGCSGALPINFSAANGLGTGASGKLFTHSVLFQNVYGTGINQFYVVNYYSGINNGTGYTMPPKAIVNTGIYSNCYDVPLNYGTNVAWFMPFNTSGALVPDAFYLTGEVLTTTGLVNNGTQTGYIVTGLNITNIGSGYNSTGYNPHVSFIRSGGDNLIKNASGTFSMKSSGSFNFLNSWKLETGIAGTTLQQVTGYTSSMTLLPNQNYISIRVSNSGLDNTQPLSAFVTLTALNGTTLTDYVTGFKYFSADSGVLKKNFNLGTGTFVPGSLLSFSLTQQDLNSFYSTAGFTNNNWGIDLGDLDF